jgi:hypothetical protein
LRSGRKIRGRNIRKEPSKGKILASILQCAKTTY